jgi:methylmalonyl-CoA mutase
MIEAMAATQGHTQSLHTNSFDEALALPTDHSARIARNTQLILQKESGTTALIDPWGGSAYVERLTHDLAALAMKHIEEVEKLGGMAAAVEKGIPKLRIEEAAARTQARIDSGDQLLVGVNAFRPDADTDVDVLKIDNAEVRARQLSKLQQLKGTRDVGAVESALGALTRAAESGENLLEFSIRAARANATVGEISLALERRSAGTSPRFKRFPASIARRSAKRLRSAGWKTSSPHSRRKRAANRVFSSPRWGRTATTAARRSSPPLLPTWAST